MKEQQIVAIYCRLSKEDLDKNTRTDESESIQNQKLLLMDYAVSSGFLIHNVYVDEDLSGFSDRPSFKQMIKDAAAGKFNIVLCKHQSRFTRDMELVEKYIHGLFPEWGIRFISLTDNVDTNVKGNKKARQIYGLINEWYSEDLSENIRTVFRKKMENGQYVGAFACYGYMKDPNNKHKLIIDEEAAAIVKEIYEMYLDGYGTFAIASTLTQRAVLTPTQYKQSKGLNYNKSKNKHLAETSGVWSPRTVIRILQNKAYIGTLIQGQVRKVSYKSRKMKNTPEDEWVVIENSHEPIIDHSVFQKVEKIYKSHRKTYKSRVDKRSKPHTLAGKIKCENCGSTMERSGATRDGANHYIRCKLSARTSKRDCTPHYMKLWQLEAKVLSSIQELVKDIPMQNNEEILEVLQSLENKDKLSDKLRKQVLDVELKLGGVKSKLVAAYSDKLNAVISENDFFTFRAAFEEKKKALESKKQLIEQQINNMRNKEENRKNICNLVKKHVEMGALTHEIVNDFIDVITIGEKDAHTGEQKVCITWLF